jgi:hypothetical protein
VEAVAAVLDTLRPPPAQWNGSLPTGINSALDVFTGYIMLDAWTANQDRHHENWGALRIDDVLYLAPTFDHGASLARNLTDDERNERMTTRDGNRKIGQFVRRARSAFYADPDETRPMTTIEAWQGFSHRASSAATIWLERLQSVDENAIAQLLGDVPPQRMSQVCQSFTRQLLIENRKRLLAGDDL